MNLMRILRNLNKCTWRVPTNVFKSFECIKAHALVPRTTAGDALLSDICASFLTLLKIHLYAFLSTFMNYLFFIDAPLPVQAHAFICGVAGHLFL